MEALDGPIEQIRILAFLQIVADLQRGFVTEYGLFVRGGIRKGPISFDLDYVFGKGLIEVVEMENKAQFPRIVIDKDLFTILTTNHLFSKEDGEEAIRIEQLLKDGKEVTSEEQNCYAKLSFNIFVMGILNAVITQLIVLWTDDQLILNYLYSLNVADLFTEQLKNNVLNTLQTQFPSDYALATLPSLSLEDILLRHKEKVEEQLNKWGSNTDIPTGDSNSAEEREKVLRKYVWSMAFHNWVCQKYEKMDYFISTQCNCDTRFVKMTIKVLNDESK